MSCPPPPFLESSFLQAAHRALAPGGVVAVNCVTRSDAAFRAAAAALQNTFPQVPSSWQERARACWPPILHRRYRITYVITPQMYDSDGTACMLISKVQQ